METNRTNEKGIPAFVRARNKALTTTHLYSSPKNCRSDLLTNKNNYLPT